VVLAEAQILLLPTPGDDRASRKIVRVLRRQATPGPDQDSRKTVLGHRRPTMPVRDRGSRRIARVRKTIAMLRRQVLRRTIVLEQPAGKFRGLEHRKLTVR
jgi:hypothetical protein